jgi:hypothetical protein
MTVTTLWSDMWLSVDDWAEAFEAPDPGTPHNEASRRDLRGAAHDSDGQGRRRRPGSPALGHLLRKSLLQDKISLRPQQRVDAD